MIIEMLSDYVHALRETTMEDTQIGINTVSGRVEAQQRGLLCLSIPYSQGWHLTVDGEKTKLLQVDTIFCGAWIEEGEHTIELKYRTPWIGTGLAVTLAGIAAWVWIGLRKRSR